MSDAELLQTYVRDGCEHSFSDVVARHIDSVYATALRQVRDVHLAEEISQAVFTLLARKAPSLTKIENLGGWLHRATCLTALKMIRSECRQRDRQQLATTMNDPATDDNEQKNLIIAAIDEAINDLPELDRVAVLARFIDRKKIADVATQMQISEDAAKKRISRAIERLRALLAKRNILVSSAAMMATLGNLPCGAAPSLLTLKVGCSASRSAVWPAIKFLGAAKVKIAMVASLLAIAGSGLFYAQRPADPVDATAATVANTPASNDQLQSAIRVSTVAAAPARPDFAPLVVQLDEALRAPRESGAVLNMATINAVRAFGLHHDEAFRHLTNRVASTNRLVFTRAIEALQLLDKTTAGLLPFLWQTAAGGTERAEYAITPLCNLGLEPADIPKLAELLPVPYLNTRLENACQLAIKADPEAAKDYLPAVEKFLSHENAEARFYAACILARAGELANPSVVSSISGALNIEKRVQLEHGLGALAAAGPGAAAAIPDLLNLVNDWNPATLEDEIYMHAPERLRLQLLRTIGAIDSSLRAKIPELDAVIRDDESATEFEEKLDRGGASLSELIAALDEPRQQTAAVSGLRDAGVAAVEAVPKLLQLLSSTYDKWHKDEIEQAIVSIDPHTKVRHIDSEQLAAALDAVHTALRRSSDDANKAFLKEMSRRYYGLINFATWYTEENLRDLSRQIASTSPLAHEVFKSNLLAADPTLVNLIE